MLDLLVAEAHQRLQRILIAQGVVAADVEHLGGDEALDHSEHVGVRPALNLAQQPAVVRGEKIEAIDHRQPVGQEMPGEVEASTANHVAIDVPADALRNLDALGVTRRVDMRLQDGLRYRHGKSPGGMGGGHDWTLVRGCTSVEDALGIDARLATALERVVGRSWFRIAQIGHGRSVRRAEGADRRSCRPRVCHRPVWHDCGGRLRRGQRMGEPCDRQVEGGVEPDRATAARIEVPVRPVSRRLYLVATNVSL